VDVTHYKITYNILVKKADSDRESSNFSKSLSWLKKKKKKKKKHFILIGCIITVRL